MRIIFDQGTPVPLRGHLLGHTIDTAYELGWSEIQNSQLLQAAEEAGYDLLMSTDQSLKYQQNLRGRRLALLVLLSASWPRMEAHVQEIAQLMGGIQSGDYREFEFG